MLIYILIPIWIYVKINSVVHLRLCALYVLYFSGKVRRNTDQMIIDFIL